MRDRSTDHHAGAWEEMTGGANKAWRTTLQSTRGAANDNTDRGSDGTRTRVVGTGRTTGRGRRATRFLGGVMGRRRKDADDTNMEAAYAELHEAMHYDALSLRALALVLHKRKRNPVFMKAASAELGRNARHMARAVDFFPPYFENGGLPRHGLTADNYLSLFAYASLPHEAAVECFAANKFDFPLYVIRERVEAAKPKREKKPTLAERCAGLVRAWYNPELGGDLEDFDVIAECANQLAALPEVKRVLEQKDADKAQ